MDDYIYYVQAISLYELTEKDLKNQHKIHNIKYKKKLSYEEFIRLKKGWKDDKYSISSFISSYHLNKEDAIEYAINNIGDINESGSYQYAAVVSAPTNISYYNSAQNRNEDFIILKYNMENYKYEELDKELPEYKALLSHVYGFIL